MWSFRKKRRSEQYLIPGRLEDVIALIQILGLDRAAHRQETTLINALESKPESAPSWVELARRHPEFFRVAKGATLSVSLIARHLANRRDDLPPLDADHIQSLVEAAIRINDGQLQRRQVMKAGRALLVVAFVPALATIGAAVIQARLVAWTWLP